MFGKTVNDLQSDIEISGNSVSGTLNFIADYSSAYGPGEDSGNYLVLHAEVPEGATVTSTTNDRTVTLDSDGILITRITDKSSQTITFVASKEGYSDSSKTFVLSDLTCLDS